MCACVYPRFPYVSADCGTICQRCRSHRLCVDGHLWRHGRRVPSTGARTPWRQCPGVFTPDEFAGEGFFLPEQPHRDNVDDVRVVCWYCGLGLDGWTVGDLLEEEHLRQSRNWRQHAGGCKWALFLRDQRRYAAGRHVHHARKSSRAEKHHPMTTWRSERVRGESPTAGPASTRTDWATGQARSASGDLALLAGFASSLESFPSGLGAPPGPSF